MSELMRGVAELPKRDRESVALKRRDFDPGLGYMRGESE